MTADDVRARFEADLLPCPFCGAKAFSKTFYGGITYISCSGSCNAYVSHRHPAEAKDAWNRRAAHADLSGKVRELVEGYRSLYRAYVNTLEVARDRIRQLGGECDPVDVMERGDPALSLARERLAKLTQEKP